MNDNLNDMGLLNEELVRIEEIFNVISGDDLKLYEVIRIIDGVPLFLEEHIKRINEGLNLLEIRKKIDQDMISKMIEKLICHYKISDNNIKLTYIDKQKELIALYFSKSYYPKLNVYKKGYSTVLIPEKRKNPNIKVLNSELKEYVAELLKIKKMDEGIYVSESKGLLEGTKSNLFFVKDNRLIFTEEKNVLKGITREKVIDICNKNNIEMIVRKIDKNELESFDAVFITGTSIKIMPVSSIEMVKYNSYENFLVKLLMEKYDKEIGNYINYYKKK